MIASRFSDAFPANGRGRAETRLFLSRVKSSSLSRRRRLDPPRGLRTSIAVSYTLDDYAETRISYFFFPIFLFFHNSVITLGVMTSPRFVYIKNVIDVSRVLSVSDGGWGGWEEGVGRRSNDDYESSRPSRRNTISRAYAFRRRRAMPELIRRPAA